ncbi:hypothetical protein [Moraxella catarrhalis]|uniref:hypothetical protein n=1 Tax=Moraxella catarrhalis TaxID=480 RepID=UPI0013D66DD9|nr:hypothetical protein [Moraxella catarrhalis]
MSNQTKIRAIKQASEQILAICETPNTALQAIHLILRHGGAGELSWQVVYQRVMADEDVIGAGYLIDFAQTAENLPFDVLPLIGLVLNKGDETLKTTMLNKLPDNAKENLRIMGYLP